MRLSGNTYTFSISRLVSSEVTIMGIIRGRRIVAVIHGNKPDFLHRKVTLDIVAGVYDISPQAREVLYNDAVDKTRFNISVAFATFATHP